ncbi:uncharacterized protein BP5553_01766 [Venustampulla echinocandica]|uniref:Cell wall protein n=1 Tax=Venustampulla echinocandica TaxID=2656787 RepID=A0A370U1Y5_9HELO|nr:uncharacterized protein BP5553_01766 [Venustampulla echinocandica]RDL41787.1 hypothetical protein BP5553_01766 [Venustampulla echinocandica]
MHFLPAIASVLALSFSAFTSASPILESSLSNRADPPTTPADAATAALSSILEDITNVKGLLNTLLKVHDLHQIEILVTLAIDGLEEELQPIKDFVALAAGAAGLSDVEEKIIATIDEVVKGLKDILANPSIETIQAAVKGILGKLDGLLGGLLSQLGNLVLSILGGILPPLPGVPKLPGVPVTVPTLPGVPA